MKVIEAIHREENGLPIVSLIFKTKGQLFDSVYPSPLPKKKLTQDAEDANLNNVFAYWLKKPVNLEIQIPMVRDPGSAKEISDAIRNHFRYVLIGHTRDTAIFIRERRTALAFTVLNILIALLYVGYVYQHAEWISTIAGTLIGGLIIIINWATIWDTYEFFFFDGREKSQRKKMLAKIINVEIGVIPLTQDS